MKTAKEFALEAIKPYFKDPSICGYSKISNRCLYTTTDGRHCVAGKYMLKSFLEKGLSGGIGNILEIFTQEKVFIPEAVGILTTVQWTCLQNIHDDIAKENEKERIIMDVDDLDLFTYEELLSQ